MSILSKIKEAVGGDAKSSNRFECQDCGERFERLMDEDDPFLRCEECRSTDVKKISEG